MSALLLVVLAQFSTEVFENDAKFEAMDTRRGVTLSKRPIKGSPYAEYRGVAEADATVEDLCVAVFEWGTKFPDGVALHKLLQDGDDERVIYNQLQKPFIANRDYALTIKRERPTPTTCRVRFRVTNDAAPKLPEGFVRMDKLWGEWRFEPLDEKKSRVTYTLFSDPAGSVPPFLVHGGQQDATREALVNALERTKAHIAKKKVTP
ncbi:MAG: hypothetical protein U0228_21530 [Myxococcaceae bacterium]